jgi:adenylate cyclase class 2
MGTEIEVELKLPISDRSNIETQLATHGATEIKSQTQFDLYLDRPFSSFSQTDEALRVRKRMPIETDIEDQSITGPVEITYKGPKLDKLSKTRLEYTIQFDDAQAILQLFEHLGFKPRLTVIKKRVYYKLGDNVISIDDVKNLGLFVEIEQVVVSESDIESTREQLFDVSRSLGLDPSTSLIASYLELLISKEST